MNPENKNSFVFLPENPYLVFSRILEFSRKKKKVRFETVMRFPEICVKVFPLDDSPSGNNNVTYSENWLIKKFGRYLISRSDEHLPEKFVKELIKKKIRLSCAESFTGGMISQMVTSVPGSSEIFLSGIVSYSNQSKVSILGVDEGVLNRYGAVSRKVVYQMLSGAMNRTGANAAIATSGIAGPSGGTIKRPVGVVFIGAGIGQRMVVKRFMFNGMTREDIRRISSFLAMKILLDIL